MYIQSCVNFRMYYICIALKLYEIMSLLKKEDIFKEFGENSKDSGSTESQIALFSSRIKLLSDHLKNNAKDYNTERSLVKLVGKRRSLLDYLTKVDVLRYRAIVKELDLRK